MTSHRQSDYQPCNGNLETKASTNPAPASNTHETSDHYAGVIARLCPRHRVIVCKEGHQAIVQRRKKGGAERPWRSLRYFRSRDALLRFCASLCGRIDPAAWAALAALPDIIGGSS